MTTTDPTQIGYLVLGLIALLQLINFAVNIWSRLRRQPPLDSTLSTFLTKEDAMVHFNKLYELDRSLRADLSEWQRSIERQLGRLDSASFPTHPRTSR